MTIKGYLILALSATLFAACGSTTATKNPNTSGQATVSSNMTSQKVKGIKGPSSYKSPASSTTQIAPNLPTTTAAIPPTTSRPSSPAPRPSGLEYGPGPQATYSVQPQPPPHSCHYTFIGTDPLPDPHCTPGALNPRVTQGVIDSTICKSGYTSSIRPPEGITEPEKRASAEAYSYVGSFWTAEYDHLVPLELGGDPNDPANLWIEPNDNPNATSYLNSKDTLENRLNSLVCSGQLSLSSAQEAIASNWVRAYQTYVGILPSYSTSTTAPSSNSANCTASATLANDGYIGDYYVTINSNQPNQKASASDAGDTWSTYTNASGYARILLYHTSSGEQITVTVGEANCSTTA